MHLTESTRNRLDWDVDNNIADSTSRYAHYFEDNGAESQRHEMHVRIVFGR